MAQNKARKAKSTDKDKDKSRTTSTQGGRGGADKKPSSKPQDWKNVPGNQG